MDESLGSHDKAADPHELLDSALAACTALTLEIYIRRRKMAVTSLRVTMDHVESKDDAGQVVYVLKHRIFIEGEISEAERARLLEIADKCSVHRILVGEISIESDLV